MFRFLPGPRRARPRRPLPQEPWSARQAQELLTCCLLASRCHCGRDPGHPGCASSSVPAVLSPGAGRWRRRTKQRRCCAVIGPAPQSFLGDVVSRRKGRSRALRPGLARFRMGGTRTSVGGAAGDATTRVRARVGSVKVGLCVCCPRAIV